MKKTYLAYKIDGKAHAEHKVTVPQLIGSLQGFWESVNETSKVLNGASVETPEINIVAFNEGSFEAVFEVLFNQDIKIDPLMVLGFSVAPPVAMAAVNSLTDLLKKARGRKIEINENADGTSTVTVDGKEKLTTTKQVAALVQNGKVRKSMDQLFSKPLENEGTEIVTLTLFDPVSKKTTGSATASVNQAESVAFKMESTVLTDSVSTDVISKVVSFTKVNFEGGSGWKMKLPNVKKPVNARIEDEEFLQVVKADSTDNKQAFRSDDLFDVKIQVTTTTDCITKKMSTVYSVIKVVNQITDKGKNQ